MCNYNLRPYSFWLHGFVCVCVSDPVWSMHVYPWLLSSVVFCPRPLTTVAGWQMSQHDMKETLELGAHGQLSQLPAPNHPPPRRIFLHISSCGWSWSLTLWVKWLGVYSRMRTEWPEGQRGYQILKSWVVKCASEKACEAHHTQKHTPCCLYDEMLPIPVCDPPQCFSDITTLLFLLLPLPSPPP